MGGEVEQIDVENEVTTREGSERDQALREIVQGKYRQTSPRSLYERANEYVPTRVRAASVGN